jgi:hypothetical protein
MYVKQIMTEGFMCCIDLSPALAKEEWGMDKLDQSVLRAA